MVKDTGIPGSKHKERIYAKNRQIIAVLKKKGLSNNEIQKELLLQKMKRLRDNQNWPITWHKEDKIRRSHKSRVVHKGHGN